MKVFFQLSLSCVIAVLASVRYCLKDSFRS